MKFSKEFLLDLVGIKTGDALNDENHGLVTVISNKMNGRGRWYISYSQIFEMAGKFYKTVYRTGATESQNEYPYEFDPDEIECVEVLPKKVTTTIYE